MDDVLVHLVEDGAYLRALGNLCRALKSGGYLICSDVFSHGADRQFENYWKGRSLASVTAAMDSCGLEVVARAPLSVLLSAPTDTRYRVLTEPLWNLVMAAVRGREWVGFGLGAILYPLELLLVSTLKESPGIEIMVCRKRGSPP